MWNLGLYAVTVGFRNYTNNLLIESFYDKE
jgi:hypothetical protein